MSHILLICQEPADFTELVTMLQKAGHVIETTHAGGDAHVRLAEGAIDLVLRDVRLTPVCPDDGGRPPAADADGVSPPAVDPLAAAKAPPRAAADEAHAAARWARAVVPIIACPRDPRTLAGWSRWIAASPGALRNWCYTAGISPRSSLVFGRLLRAVTLREGGRHKPANLLDVVDRRTLSRLLAQAGFTADDFACTIDEFLDRQTIVRDPDALIELRRVLAKAQPTAVATVRALSVAASLFT